MILDACENSDPSYADRKTLTEVLHDCVEQPKADLHTPRFKVTLVDHPCGFGKTNSLLAVINAKPDQKFLIVVNTLDEVDRVLSGVSEGLMYAPRDPSEVNTNKSEQLEAMLVAEKSVVITHKLYERAGRLADGGLLQDYSVIIDEVPNAISTLQSVKPGSMEEFYVERGFLSLSPSGELRVTQKWQENHERYSDTLKDYIYNASLGRGLFYDGTGNLITSIPVSLFDSVGSATVLTFLSSGSLLTKFLEQNNVRYKTKKVPGALERFKTLARELLSIETIPALEKVPYSYSKQNAYLVSSKEAKTTATALKNLRQRRLTDIEADKILLTCSKGAWYKKSRRGEIDEARPGAFAKDSRLFNKANWIPNTTRGTNKYNHCSHLIYLYDQNANPVLMNWLKVNDPGFRKHYALTEMIQWIWRSQIRNGLPVTVFMPSAKMRSILEDWLSEV